ncbi:hypothetical protein OKA05_05095 [Luteolibacter arcticus]|uniref:Uncharacterized protein n=1 Tax=Luteolibacter arcticus TaxID=1581411 RepID=A0ABT3GE69_9BACT|nr:hypothetical protein [Luteolibacter arcticus]MCW1921917.1 hypothetical protein [Luteolibacter arcticus]
MTPDARSPKEKRWFNIMLGFSAVAAMDFIAMTGMNFWATDNFKSLDRSSPAAVESAHGVLRQVQTGILVGQGILLICCVGFFFAGASWLIAMRKRKAGGLG